MESSSIVLLYQLTMAYEQFYESLEKSCNAMDKAGFESSKNKILEIQRKIEAILA